VIVTGRNPDNAEPARRELDGRAHVLLSDVSKPEDIDAQAAYAAEHFGQIDFVHFNAGIAILEPFTAVTEQTYDLTFDVNTKGAFFTVQRLAPLVSDGGSIVFTSSVADDAARRA